MKGGETGGKSSPRRFSPNLKVQRSTKFIKAQFVSGAGVSHELANLGCVHSTGRFYVICKCLPEGCPFPFVVCTNGIQRCPRGGRRGRVTRLQSNERGEAITRGSK